jgi:hypothetical protein
MNKLARAIEILEAINEHFQEGYDQTVLYSDARILDGNITIKDAIAECISSRNVMTVRNFIRTTEDGE